MSRSLRSLLGVVLVVGTAACWRKAPPRFHQFGIGQPEQHESGQSLVLAQPFPDEARIDEIAQQPAPPLPKAPRMRGTDAWQLRGPLPDAVTSTLATDERSRALAKVLGGGERRVTEPMTCFARELGLFILAFDAQPAIDLKQWIAARCGVGHAGATLALSRIGHPRARLFDIERDAPHVEAVAAKVPEASDFGVAVVDDGDRGIAVVATVPRAVNVADVAMVPTGGEVIVRGFDDAPIGGVFGFATRGEDGFSQCRPIAAEGASPNAFALACPIDPEDASASVEIAIGGPGDVLAHEVLTLWVSPRGTLSDAWTARAVAVPVSGEERGALEWLTAINAVRERLGLRVWSHAIAQTELVGGLLPHFIAARNDPRLQDEIALGMLAGWKVEGTISNGDLRSVVLPRDVPFDRMVGAAMASPIFRARALAPQSATAAIAVSDDAAARASHLVLLSYELFEPRDYTAAQEAFLDQLDAQRAARDLPPVKRVGDPADRRVLDAAAERVRVGERQPMDELQGLLDHFSKRAGQAMHGVVYTTLTLDGYRPDFDGPLVKERNVAVVTKIASWHPDGSAWGQHVVYVLYLIPGER
ncbi:MAG TPA: hypothetical protein VG755_28790 [Nannocystaceae bacterium]|nr:hypothetical protein [Nannocystaceae bacterium]